MTLKKEIVANLKDVLINETIKNVNKDIIMLREIFSTSYNKEYLEYWFIFFEEDFFLKTLRVIEKQYQWMQKFLVKFKNEVMSDEKKELEFLFFKLEKEKFFSWNEEIAFEFLYFTIIWINQKISTKKEFIYKAEALEGEIKWRLKLKKWELEKKLYKTCDEQDLILNYYNNSLKKLDFFEKQKLSKIFIFKNKLLILFTFGYYNFEGSLINKIESEKVSLNNKKQQLYKIGLKICNIRKKLNKVELKIRKKTKRFDFFNENIVSLNKEINLINIANNTISTNNGLIPQL